MGLRTKFRVAALAATLSVTARPAVAYHEFRMITEEDLHRWAHQLYDEALAIINGPQLAPMLDHSALDCAMLYERRIALYRKNVTPNPSFTDDPRNKAAIFIGTIFTPAFFYLPYSAIMSFREDNARIYRESQLDGLRYASAQHDCFVR